VDVFLYQLNLSGLTASAVMIALFFAVLWHSNRRAEMRWWTYGWTANVVALWVTAVFWYAQPPATLHGLVFGVYLIPKCLYVWLLLRGALEFGSIRPRRLTAAIVVPAILVFSTIALFVVTTRDRLGLAASVIVAVGFGAGGLLLAHKRASSSMWLIVGFAVRATLAAMEGAAYAVNLAAAAQPVDSLFAVPANALLAAHYTLDIGAEWLLAMGCVIAITTRTQHDLERANGQMLEAQAGLRRLADRDPLTALANRRALPDVLRAVQPIGATLIFFDMDGFKKINDERGHQTGDQCLIEFAAALTQCFRPSDAVVRYAGDEFLVVASGLDEAAVSARVGAVRTRVAQGSLPLRFSAGVSHLAAHGDPDEAVRMADEAMYRAKSAGRRRKSGRRRAAVSVLPDVSGSR